MGRSSADKALVEECGRRFGSALPHATIVIRASKHGAAVWNPSSQKAHWVPAYWTTPDHVVDVVGAGNAFCGG